MMPIINVQKKNQFEPNFYIEEEHERVVLTYNAKGCNSPGKTRQTLLANLGAVSQVQTA